MLRIAPAVRQALANKKPIVALESTIISHGMPYPQNLEMARGVEQVVQENGATPATIALLDGKIHVGLDDDALRQLAEAGHSARKCSRRDMAKALADRAIAATTVAGTMYVADLVGIEVFATGGVGGVHRDGQNSMDISADLTELSKTPVAVVCAGVKSILDIQRTLEFLETQGVPVIGYGTDSFPAFFSVDSGFPSPLSVRTGDPAHASMAAQCAKIIHCGHSVGMDNGYVIAVPNPNPADAAGVEAATAQALAEADAQGIAGRDITPFLLGRVNELSSGDSLRSNIALVRNNARVAAEIAVELAALGAEGGGEGDAVGIVGTAVGREAGSGAGSRAGAGAGAGAEAGRVVVVGGATLDMLATPPAPTKLTLETSNPGSMTQSWGGVARNIAEGLSRLGCRPLLLSAVGADIAGRSLVSHCESLGMRVDGIRMCGGGSSSTDASSTSYSNSNNAFLDSNATRTATYTAMFHGDGELLCAVADMGIMDAAMDASLLDGFRAELTSAEVVVVDGNVGEDTLLHLADICTQPASPARIVFEPTSLAKATRACVCVSLESAPCFPFLEACLAVTPNAMELEAMAAAVRTVQVGAAQAEVEVGVRYADGEYGVIACGALGRIEEAVSTLLVAMTGAGAAGDTRHIIVTMGKDGVLLASASRDASQDCKLDLEISRIPAIQLASPQAMVNCTGAGDSLVAGMVYGLLDGAAGDVRCAMQMGVAAAKMSVESPIAISPNLSPAALSALVQDG